MTARYTAEAVRQIDRLFDFTTERNPAAAKRILGRIAQTIGLLQSFPQSGRTGPLPHTRELRVARTPYLIVYRVEKDAALTILAVYHTAQRRPGQAV